MVSRNRNMEGAGGRRSMQARWVVTGELRLVSAAHFGGDDGNTDMPLLRDAREGCPLLPGSSLAGALRSHLGDRLGSFRSVEHQEVERLFGAERTNDQGDQSPLVLFDSW